MNSSFEVIVEKAYGCINIYEPTLENAQKLLQKYESYGEYSISTDPDIYRAKYIREIITFIRVRAIDNEGSDIEELLVTEVKEKV